MPGMLNALSAEVAAELPAQAIKAPPMTHNSTTPAAWMDWGSCPVQDRLPLPVPS